MPDTQDNLDADQVVDTHWPYDGPHDDDHTVQAARALPHLVRYLNNATGPGHQSSALPYAAAADRVLANVAGAIGLLPQLLDQLAGFLTDQGRNDPTLHDDRRYGPNAQSAPVTAAEAAIDLKEAGLVARRLAAVLQAARARTVHLGNDDPTPGTEADDLG